MTETLANGYLSESTQRELSNEYQHNRVLDGFQKYLRHCALDEVTSVWEGLAVFPLQMIDGLIFRYFGHCTHAVVAIGDFPSGLE